MEVIRHKYSPVNIQEKERMLSGLVGGALLISGLKNKKLGPVRAIASAALLHRAITGHCYAFEFLGIRTAPTSAALPYELGVRARAATTINQPKDMVFRFWRQLENLPIFMRHLESVRETDEIHSEWVAIGPLDHRVKWTAEIINEVPGEIIAWQSLPGSEVQSAGSVRFQDAPDGRGTEVRVELQYNPPAGVLGAQVARLFGREPEQEITADLARLKQYLETGEVATIKGQPRGGVSSKSKSMEPQEAYL